MPTGSIRIYASVAGQAAPLSGVQVAVLDESGVAVARLTTDEAGAAEAAALAAPDAAYSLRESNTNVRPYAVYRLRAEAAGWQSQLVDGVQVFDGQQTVARLEFLPGGGDGDALPAREAAPRTTTIPPHVLFAGGGGSGPAPEERLPGKVLSEVVVLHLHPELLVKFHTISMAQCQQPRFYPLNVCRIDRFENRTKRTSRWGAQHSSGQGG